MTHRLRILATALLLVPFALSPAHATAAPVPSRDSGIEALLVGDSVLNGLARPYSAAGRAALALRHSFLLEAAGCRRLITTSCRIPPGSAPTNALTVVRVDAGRYDRALVIAAGYDDPSSGQFGIGAAVDVLLNEAHQQGIEHVIWLTYREAGPEAPRFRASNAVLRAKVAEHPELALADWAGRSAGLPSGWFSADGIHLGAQAAAAMGELIGDALDALPAIPSRCSSQVWSGDPASHDAVGGAGPATGAVDLLASPVRLVDTRSAAGALGADRVLTIPVAGMAGVPSDAAAALVSVVAVDACADTYLTVFPCGSGAPTTSVVNAVASSTVANSAVVRLGHGAICVYTPQATDVIVDLSGWIGRTGLLSTPVSASRLVDTRPAHPQALAVDQSRLRAGHILTVDLTTTPGYDSSTAAASVNVTAVAPAAGGYLTVLPGPCAAIAAVPSTSTVNVVAGRDVAASATVALGSGQLCVYTSVDTDVIVDLQAFHGATGGRTTSVDPTRLVDTRTTQRVSAGRSITVAIDHVAAGAIINVTSVSSAANGFVALYPCGELVPAVSDLNLVAGLTVANRAIVRTGGANTFCAYSSVDTDLVIDVEGWIEAG